MCAVLGIVNKFYTISAGTLVAYGLFFYGFYLQTKMISKYYQDIAEATAQLTTAIINKFIVVSHRYFVFTRAISKLKITDDEERNMRKLYQIRRIAFKIQRKNDVL